MDIATNSIGQEHFVSRVRGYALLQAEQRAFTFLNYAAEPSETVLTRAELDARARAIAVRLQRVVDKGDRALLLYRPGLDFICGFLGCLYAGVVAVPVTVPRYGHGKDRMLRIFDDCDAKVLLTTEGVKPVVVDAISEVGGAEWICTDTVDGGDADAWSEPDISMQDIVFLQYSSGSTGQPKGVAISHANLMAQSEAFRGPTGAHARSCFVSWLPTFHDLGLVAGVLQPLYAGYRGVLMAPDAFVETPLRWLKAISDYGADITAAPNFAYELCLRKITPEQRAELDLSRLRFVLNGAEPVRAGTIEEFSSAFASSGFRRSAFYPAYGLAEATLMMAGAGNGPNARAFDAGALEQNRVLEATDDGRETRLLVSCGTVVDGHRIRIVAPESARPVDERQVGEIWIAGPSVGMGYWRRDAETADTFGARIAGEMEKYLRSGDLGFIVDGELFVCGRLKDLILIRGRNHHAPDIEATVEACHPALRPSCGAAFPVEMDDEEKLVVVHEIDRATDISDAEHAAIIAAIRAAIAEHHEIQVHAVVLLRHGTVPKTSSGKIQRRNCRARYLEGSLRARASWVASTAVQGGAAGKSPEALEIERWMLGDLALQLGMSADVLDARKPVQEYGLAADKLFRVIRAAELRLARPLPNTFFSEFHSVESAAQYLAVGTGTAKPVEQALLPKPRGEAVLEPIAIVGIGCRFPQANGPREFWNLLCDGVDAVGEVPPERWDVDEVYDTNPLAVGKMNTRWGGFLRDVDQLDRKFFNLSIREAVRMDPQHRLMLETAWEALEDAGIVPDSLGGTQTGVFVGISGSDYAQMQFSDPSLTDAYAGLGCALTIAASRVSHTLNLCGPAIAVDTACSSSLSAVHLACRSLRQGECQVALAGGVNILLSPVTTMCLTKAGMMSPDGRCMAFDARANGYVRSEGAGIVVLKPLSKALADGDSIYAVIRGTASNQDGRSSGIAAPNGDAQQAVILSACADADISPGQLDYVEAHGTGTPVGDPIEVKALGAVLKIGREGDQICAIGSVKTNIGHCESAAGVASLIKAALVLKTRRIPASLHFNSPNPQIPFDRLPLRVQTELGTLPERGRPRLVGVNGFGVGGTNVHLVLEEAPAATAPKRAIEPAAAPLRRPWVLPVTARSQASLKANAASLQALLRAPGADADLPDLCHTLSLRRGHLEQRIAAVGADAAELADALDAYLDKGYCGNLAVGAAVLPDARPKLAFLFSGQGSQWWRMGRGLLEREPEFREVIETCDALLRPLVGWSLLEELTAAEDASRLEETQFAQPALFAVQVGIARLLASWGVEPDSVAGHSVGEVAAAHICGSLSLPDAVWLIARRASLMQRTTGLGGRMASVELSLRDLQALFPDWDERLSVAAVNGPASVVLSGDGDALEAALAHLQQRGVTTVALPVNYAFHSAQMEPVKLELIEALEGLAPSPSRIPLYSTVTGKLQPGEALGADYWGANMRQAVLLSDAVQALASAGTTLFLEIGPHPVLTGYLSRTLKAAAHRGTVLASLRRDTDDQYALASAFAALFVHGRDGAWKALSPQGELARAVPTYCWDRQRYWLDIADSKPRRNPDGHPLLGAPLLTAQPTWQGCLDGPVHSFVREFRYQSQERLPLGAAIEMALAAAAEGTQDTERDICDLEFGEPAALADQDALPQVQVAVSADGPDARILVHVLRGVEAGAAAWDLQVGARLRGSGAARRPTRLDLRAIRDECPDELSGADFYRRLGEAGLHYAGSLQGVDYIRRGEEQVLLRLRLDDVTRSALPQYRLHPAVIEAILQAARIAHGAEGLRYRPTSAQRLRLYADVADAAELHVHARPRPRGHDADGAPALVDAALCDAEGAVLALLEGISLTAEYDASVLAVADNPDAWLYDLNWDPAELVRVGAVPEMPGDWLVLCDSGGTGQALAMRLRASGVRCVEVHYSSVGFAALGEDSVAAASDPDSLRRVLRTVGGDGRGIAGIVHAWSLDGTSAEAASAGSITADQALGSVAVLHLLQAIAANEARYPPRLFLLTRGVQYVADVIAPFALSHAPLWGLGKVIAMEHPELRCCRIDLDPVPDVGEASRLLDECRAGGNEDQVAFRGAQRYVARLRPHALSDALSARDGVDIGLNRPFRAIRSDMDSDTIADAAAAIRIAPLARRAPAPGEIEIRVLAAGLDRRDTRCDGAARPRSEGLGDTCSGIVLRVGSGATGFAPGDAVIALADGALASSLTVDARCAARLPASLDSAEAVLEARVVTAALYALRTLAELAAGERVLIHGAGSAVGMAAVRIARHLGATVFATAGSQEESARLSALGVEAVFDAHRMSLSSDVRRYAGADGVDVLLNCEAGWELASALQSLAPFGRCVDVAPTQEGKHGQMQRSPLKGNVSLYRVDFDLLRRASPERVGRLLEDALSLIADDTRASLHMRPFPIDGMARSPSALALGDAAERLAVVLPEPAHASDLHELYRADATYLITGGLGALGLSLAERMVQHGAKHLLLLGRRSPSDVARRALERMRRHGAEVTVAAVDVSDLDQLRALFAGIATTLPPLRGLVHAAGILENGLLVQLDEARFQSVMESKVAGAWNLHMLCKDMTLDFFVMFSSLASLIGSPGQGNYAAANAYLESLAEHRKAQGLPGLSVGWGPWAEIGMAADVHNLARLMERGMGMLPPQQALGVLERMLPATHGNVGAIAMNWPLWGKMYPAAAQAPFVAHLTHIAKTAVVANSGKVTTDALAGLDQEGRIARLETTIQRVICQVFQIDPEQLPVDLPLSAVGLDSIVALELKGRLEAAVNVVVQTPALLKGPTVRELANLYSNQLRAEPAREAGTTADGAPSAPDAERLLDSLDRLSDTEVEELLASLTEKES